MKRIIKPEIIGTGLISLDIVISSKNKDNAFPWVGGTCGNVLTIMSYLGWKSTPIGRLDDSFSSLSAKSDMRRWGLNMEYIDMEPTRTAPIIMQVNTIGASGIPQHKFIWRSCPKCGSWLPSYSPITKNNAKTIKEKIKSGTLYFFDRTSPGALELANHFKQMGSIIMFEPSAKGKPEHIEEAVKYSDIVKYSNQRLTPDLQNSLKKHPPFLQIETMGGSGLKYRTKKSRNWKYLLPFSPKALLDTSGCGDWTTAGIIYKLCSEGKKALLIKDDEIIEDALNFGQALGAWNCEFEGPRHGMYTMDKQVFIEQINSILKIDNRKKTNKKAPTEIKTVTKFCPNCK
jgi:sugar/nucleoside kinase (ribokinase family)